MRPEFVLPARRLKPPSSLHTYLWDSLTDIRWLLSGPPTITDTPAPENATTTILIPALNIEAGYLTPAVKSLQRQKRKPFSIIIVENGKPEKDPTEATFKEAQTLAAQYDNVYVLRAGYTGSKAGALNFALDYCLDVVDGVVVWKECDIPFGETFMVMDADTAFEDDVTDLLVRHFKDPEVAVACGYVRNKLPDDGKPSLWWRAKLIEYVLGQAIIKKIESAFGVLTVSSGCISKYHTELVMLAGKFSARTKAEDMDITLALQVQGWKAVYEPRAHCWAAEPETIDIFWNQRRRWHHGYLQCYVMYFWKLFQHNFRLFSMLNMTFLMSLIGFLITFYELYQLGLSLTSGTGSLTTWHELYKFLQGSALEVLQRNVTNFSVIIFALCWFSFLLGGPRLMLRTLTSFPAFLIGIYVVLGSFAWSIISGLLKIKLPEWSTGHAVLTPASTSELQPTIQLTEGESDEQA